MYIVSKFHVPIFQSFREIRRQERDGRFITHLTCGVQADVHDNDVRRNSLASLGIIVIFTTYTVLQIDSICNTTQR